MRLATLSRYWHTLRFLKPVQFYGRLWFKMYRPRPRLSPPPRLRSRRGDWYAPAARDSSLSGPREFTFLGQVGSLQRVGWDGPEREKLWRYNQHYFDDLNAAGSKARREWHHTLLIDWVNANPPGIGNGWEPYPTSLRIVNWIKWKLAGNPLPPVCIESLAVQARWLRRRLEIHLLGNHLFANAKALFFAGCFFEGEEAHAWRSVALRILRREISEQVLADGGHFERSTMYHVLATEDMLDLCNIAHAYRPRELAEDMLAHWRSVAAVMLRWLAIMSHPDQGIAFFNDAAFGVAPDNHEIFAYADRLGFNIPASVLPSGPESDVLTLQDSGYVVLRHDYDSKLIADVGSIGPDYLPGHAHADTLSFELSLFGHRVMVNSGTSCYGTGRERIRQRGTGAHNTVQINGENSSEVWSGFRVAKRARGWIEHLDRRAAAIRLTASHDGYMRLPGANLHTREWNMSHGSLVVIDRIFGHYEQAVARFHLHPEIEVVNNPDALALHQGSRWIASVRFEGEGGIRVAPSSWHPTFGKSIPSLCIEVELCGGFLKTYIDWGEEC